MKPIAFFSTLQLHNIIKTNKIKEKLANKWLKEEKNDKFSN